MEKQKIFFSYSRADGSAFAQRLAIDLKKKDFDVWIDQEDIRAGRDWDIEIGKALESCDCLLFIETEKSVVSNNVLDEVYYALEQKKKVIPLIYVDSRTPFRLNRLQHIDFTKSYDTGLAQLVNELEGNTPAVISPADEPVPFTATYKPFYKKKYGTLLIVTCITVLVAAIIMLATKNRGAASAEANGPIALTDTLKNKTSLTDTPNTPVISKKEGEDKYSKDGIVPIENKKKAFGKKAPAGSINVNPRSSEASEAKTESNLNNLNEFAAGDWRLTSVEPKVKSQSGYLKIEVLNENKAAIKSYIQFYYPDSKASSYPTIFNAFAGCTSCAVSKEMKLKVEDIAVGSRTIKKLQEDQPNGGKAGDIILDAHSNKSIGGMVTLKFIDNNNAVMRVQQPISIRLSDDLMLEPFVYTFHFEKRD